MQVDPINPTLKPPGTKHLKLKCDILLSRSAFKFNLRHYSGVCACVQHFFFNAQDLEWLVTLQGALTFAGNSGMCVAAAQLAAPADAAAADAEVDAEVAEAGPTWPAGLRGRGVWAWTGAGAVATSKPGAGGAGAAGTGATSGSGAGAAGGWYNFDVEGFAPLWARDGDAVFAAKIAALSLGVAAAVRAASLAAGPYFTDVSSVGGGGGQWGWARGGVAAGAYTRPPFSST